MSPPCHQACPARKGICKRLPVPGSAYYLDYTVVWRGKPNVAGRKLCDRSTRQTRPAVRLQNGRRRACATRRVSIAASSRPACPPVVALAAGTTCKLGAVPPPKLGQTERQPTPDSSNLFVGPWTLPKCAGDGVGGEFQNVGAGSRGLGAMRCGRRPLGHRIGPRPTTRPLSLFRTRHTCRLPVARPAQSTRPAR